MGIIFIDTGPNTQLNSGSTDANAADLSGTATYSSGSNTVVLDALTDLSAVDATPGSATQSTINIVGATNQISWITGKSGSGGATPTLTLAANITGGGSGNYKIGGRITYLGSNSTNISVAAIRAGDFQRFNNSPVSRTAAFVTGVTNGDTTNGMLTFFGDPATRPTLAITNNTKCLTASGKTKQAYLNFTLQQTGGSTNEVLGSGLLNYNIKITSGAAVGMSTGSGQFHVVAEITGVGGNAYDTTASHHTIVGYNIHDNAAIGISFAGPTGDLNVIWSILDTNAAQGIYKNFNETGPQTDQMVIDHCTFYGNTLSGLQNSDADSPCTLTNCIFLDNGGGTGYNVYWEAGSIDYNGCHFNNCYRQTTGPNTNNLSGLTVNSTEIVTDPVLTDPANGNFLPAVTSPCRSTGYPGQFIGSVSSLGYATMGAVQPALSGYHGIYFNPTSMRA